MHFKCRKRQYILNKITYIYSGTWTLWFTIIVNDMATGSLKVYKKMSGYINIIPEDMMYHL